MINTVKIIVFLAIVLLCHNISNASDAIGYMPDDNRIAATDTIRDTTDKQGFFDAIAKVEEAGYRIINVKSINKGKQTVIIGVKGEPELSPYTVDVTQDNSNTSGEYDIYEGQIFRNDGSAIKTRSYVKDGVLVRKTIGDVDLPLPDNVKLQ